MDIEDIAAHASGVAARRALTHVLLRAGKSLTQSREDVRAMRTHTSIRMSARVHISEHASRCVFVDVDMIAFLCLYVGASRAYLRTVA